MELGQWREGPTAQRWRAGGAGRPCRGRADERRAPRSVCALQGWIIGAVINVIGSIMINLGTNITKLGHNKTAAAAPEQPPLLRK